MTDRLSLPELESHLWGAATILRGLVDAGDYKQFIFPLLFYKRLSDVWDEEYAQALEESGDMLYAAGMANERFVIPAGAHWKDVRETPKDVGQAIQNALRVHRGRQPGPAGRDFRRRTLDEQGAPAGSHTQEPAGAFLTAHALDRQRARG